jgi:hypothetical protein
VTTVDKLMSFDMDLATFDENMDSLELALTSNPSYGCQQSTMSKTTHNVEIEGLYQEVSSYTLK